MITREDLQRLHDLAVGNGRRYYADSYVKDLVTAVGEYLAQDDPTVEVAYLRATIADLKAGSVIPGQNSDKPQRPSLPDPKGGCACRGYSEDHGAGYVEQMVEYEPACPEHSEHVYNPRTGVWDLSDPSRVQPSREELARAIDPSAWVSEFGPNKAASLERADTVLTLLDGRPTVAEVREHELREAAAVARLDRVGGLTWIARAVEAWLNARAGHIAAAGHEAEGGAR